MKPSLAALRHRLATEMERSFVLSIVVAALWTAFVGRAWWQEYVRDVKSLSSIPETCVALILAVLVVLACASSSRLRMPDRALLVWWVTATFFCAALLFRWRSQTVGSVQLTAGNVCVVLIVAVPCSVVTARNRDSFGAWTWVLVCCALVALFRWYDPEYGRRPDGMLAMVATLGILGIPLSGRGIGFAAVVACYAIALMGSVDDGLRVIQSRANEAVARVDAVQSGVNAMGEGLGDRIAPLAILQSFALATLGWRESWTRAIAGAGPHLLLIVGILVFIVRTTMP